MYGTIRTIPHSLDGMGNPRLSGDISPSVSGTIGRSLSSFPLQMLTHLGQGPPHTSGIHLDKLGLRRVTLPEQSDTSNLNTKLRGALVSHSKTMVQRSIPGEHCHEPSESYQLCRPVQSSRLGVRVPLPSLSRNTCSRPNSQRLLLSEPGSRINSRGQYDLIGSHSHRC